jgi:glutamate 5-kinase
MHAFEELFSAHKTRIAQVLLTEDDFANWSRYQNLRRTMERLLKLGVLPIVNENDTVSGVEIEQVRADGQRVFSDNDVLSALVMSKLDAEVLVLLTSVDGLLQQQPLNQNGRVLKLVREITPEIEALAAGPSLRGRGGMITKLEAAKIAMCSGFCVIANGKRRDTLPLIFGGKPAGTVFVPSVRVRGRRRWIAFTTRLRGQVTVNEGAREAILRSKASLLASGVIEVGDQFAAGEVVSIVDQERVEFARGIVNCDSGAIEQMKRQSGNQRKRAKDHVVITRDNIVLNPSSGAFVSYGTRSL